MTLMGQIGASATLSRRCGVPSPWQGERDLIERNPFSRVSPTKPRKQQVVKLDEHCWQRDGASCYAMTCEVDVRWHGAPALHAAQPKTCQ